MNLLLSALDQVDGWLALWLSGLVRVCIWGILSGCAAMVIYVLCSDQAGITALKAQTRGLQRKILDSEEHAEVMALVKKNLGVSLRLLAKIFLPSMLASVPVLIPVLWLSVFQSYALPPAGETVGVRVVPANEDLTFLPADGFVRESGDLRFVVGAAGESVKVVDGERVLYEGNPEDPPAAVVYKRQWWNALLDNTAGYVDSDARVDEIHWSFPRKVFAKELPEWLVTWEFPFFVSLFVAAIFVKIRFRIQ